MEKDDVADRKISPRDFPPSAETDKLLIWSLEELDMNPKDVRDNSVFNINLETHIPYETRVYNSWNNNTIFKILSKQNIKTKNISVLIRIGDRYNNEQEFTIEGYRMVVSRIENDIKKAYDVKGVLVTSPEEHWAAIAPIVERYKKQMNKE